jgi:hypothetical protein
MALGVNEKRLLRNERKEMLIFVLAFLILQEYCLLVFEFVGAVFRMLNGQNTRGTLIRFEAWPTANQLNPTTHSQCNSHNAAVAARL